VTLILRIRTVLSGWQGGPGLSTHYFLPGTAGGVTADAVDCCGRVRAFWIAAGPIFPTTVGMQTSGAVDIIEAVTGQLTGGLSGGSPAGVSGTAGTGFGPYSTDVLLRAQTGVVINGRRVEGRWFLGPACTAANVGGVPTAAVGTNATNAGAALNTGATASVPVVWHRPHGSPPVGGLHVPISGYQASPEFAVLRSRRD
jgi:hypothetical protein